MNATNDINVLLSLLAMMLAWSFAGVLTRRMCEEASSGRGLSGDASGHHNGATSKQAARAGILVTTLFLLTPTAFGQTSPEQSTTVRLPPPEPAQNGELAEQAVVPAVDQVGDQAVIGGEFLALADVIASLYRSFPNIELARQESQRTSGELRSAYGAYDTKLQGYTLSEPTGFYRNYRNGIGVARQTWWGGYLSAGYRIGRGDFQPWYKERETDKSGEFKLAMVLPTLQGRAIDPQRVAVFQARLDRQSVSPLIQQAILDASRDAALAYWSWVASGAILEAQQELLELAEIRGEQYEAGVKAGRFAEIDLVLNRQLIAERAGKVLVSEQKFRASGFKLGLYLRNELGEPLVPSDDWLPNRFPTIQRPPEREFLEDLAAAIAQRPEPRLLQLELSKTDWERRLAYNNLLPQLDFVAEASQDAGAAATTNRDKGRFQLVVGAQTEVPIQRRKARGKIQSTTAKLAQLNQKLRLQRDKIATELQTADNALLLSTRIVEQADVSLQAAVDSLNRYRFAFEKGKIDLIYLNLLESKANETEIKLVDAQRNWFAALADLQAALGLDPLDQAMIVSELPRSTRPAPGSLPPPIEQSDEAFNQDWERRTNPNTTP